MTDPLIGLFSSTAVQAVLTVLEDLAPLITNSKQISGVVTFLEQIIPVVVQEAQDLLQPIQNIIAALSANPAATSDQLAALTTLDAQVDAAFEAAATAYQAAHPAT
jgi:hypothetical protein